MISDLRNKIPGPVVTTFFVRFGLWYRYGGTQHASLNGKWYKGGMLSRIGISGHGTLTSVC